MYIDPLGAAILQYIRGWICSYGFGLGQGWSYDIKIKNNIYNLYHCRILINSWRYAVDPRKWSLLSQHVANWRTVTITVAISHNLKQHVTAVFEFEFEFVRSNISMIKSVGKDLKQMIEIEFPANKHNCAAIDWTWCKKRFFISPYNIIPVVTYKHTQYLIEQGNIINQKT